MLERIVAKNEEVTPAIIKEDIISRMDCDNNYGLFFVDHPRKNIKVAGIEREVPTKKQIAEIMYEVADENPKIIQLLTLLRNYEQSEQTYNHSNMVAAISIKLAKEYGLSDEKVKDVCLAAYLHDIGKLNTPHEILEKPTRLDPDEFEVIKKHPRSGIDTLKQYHIDVSDEVLEAIAGHHCNEDGTGYGITINNEPGIIRQIITASDILEATTGKRDYNKEGRNMMDSLNRILFDTYNQIPNKILPLEDAIREMKNNPGLMALDVHKLQGELEEGEIVLVNPHDVTLVDPKKSKISVGLYALLVQNHREMLTSPIKNWEDLIEMKAEKDLKEQYGETAVAAVEEIRKQREIIKTPAEDYLNLILGQVKELRLSGSLFYDGKGLEEDRIKENLKVMIDSIISDDSISRSLANLNDREKAEKLTVAAITYSALKDRGEREIFAKHTAKKALNLDTENINRDYSRKWMDKQRIIGYSAIKYAKTMYANNEQFMAQTNLDQGTPNYDARYGCVVDRTLLELVQDINLDEATGNKEGHTLKHADNIVKMMDENELYCMGMLYRHISRLRGLGEKEYLSPNQIRLLPENENENGKKRRNVLPRAYCGCDENIAKYNTFIESARSHSSQN